MVATLSLIGLGGITMFSTTLASPSEDAVQVVGQTQIFAIEKMTCAMCPITVKKAMSKIEGVKTVVMDFDAKIATAIFDPTVTTASEIAAASTNAGYPATPIDK